MIKTGISTFDAVANFFLLMLIAYPILGSFCWLIGTICYQFLYAHRITKYKRIDKSMQPFVTIMIPAHNEEVMIADTINYLMTELNYSNYEVLVVDDGSTDDTPLILHGLMAQYSNLKVIRIEKNQGKAHAFNIGIAFTKGEFILSNDADSLPEPDAIWKYMNYFNTSDGQNIAAVTANMDVQNRDTIISKSQTVEFSSIVGIIKRSQVGVFGNMYAYSGANTMYRRDALIDVGLFRQDRATEDISIAWDHQTSGWSTVFAPNILFYMNVPDNLKSLYNQRKRWAKGGTEVWLTNFWKIVLHPFRYTRQIAFIIDQTFSITWSFFYFISLILFIGSVLSFLFTGDFRQVIFLFAMSFVFITFEMLAGIIQLGAALLVDEEGKKFKYLIFMPFYSLVYWQVNAFSVVTTFIPAVRTIMGHGSGTWVSPKRHKNIKSN